MTTRTKTVDYRASSVSTYVADDLPLVPPVQILDRLHSTEHILFWQYRGTSTFIVDGEYIPAHDKQALWLPAGYPHDIFVNANSVLLRIFFSASDVSIFSEMNAPYVIHVDHELADSLMGIVQSDSSLIQCDHALDQYVLDKVGQRLLASHRPENSTARKVADYLNDSPGDGRTLAELAEQVHTSPRTIERIFLTETGVTFQEWRMQSRIAKAKQLIIEGLPISAVALRVGYSTASSFGRAFKKRTGLSPSNYLNLFVDGPS